MEKIHIKPYDKNSRKHLTMQLEEFINILKRELCINTKVNYQIRLLTIKRSETRNIICVSCYRSIDRSLAKALKNQQAPCVAGYHFSNEFILKDENGNGENKPKLRVAITYDDTGYGQLIKEYLEFLTKNLINMIETSLDQIQAANDASSLLKSQLYIWSKEFVNTKITRAVVPLSRLSYLPNINDIEEISKMSYESEALSGKFIAISTNKSNKCNILLKNGNAHIRLHETKKIRKLLEITF